MTESPTEAFSRQNVGERMFAMRSRPIIPEFIGREMLESMRDAA